MPHGMQNILNWVGLLKKVELIYFKCFSEAGTIQNLESKI